MKTAIFLTLPGTSEEAAAFYRSIFGGTELDCMRYGDLEGSVCEAEDARRVLHGEARLLDMTFMFSDTRAGEAAPAAGGRAAIDLYDLPVDEARRYYEGLRAGATILAPLAATWWSGATGRLIDRFGVAWTICARGA